MDGFNIGFGIDSDRRNAEVTAGANYSHRNLAPISN
jgi:hypothetical protein